MSFFIAEGGEESCPLALAPQWQRRTRLSL